MTTCDHDASVDTLERLVTLAPDPARSERVRARCRTQLGRSRRRAARTAETGFAWRLLPAVVGALCVFYVTALVVTTLRLEAVFN